MKSLLLALAIFALSTITLQAQNQKNSLFSKASKPSVQVPHFLAGTGDEYYLIVSTDNYAPLTGATDITGGITWDDPTHFFPLGFTFSLFGTAMDSILLDGLGAEFFVINTTTFSSVHNLIATHVDLIDRGVVAAGGLGIPGSQSPIVYKTEGTAPNRIFKMEWQNAGFYNEWDALNTTNDFINLQLWIYEGSNNIDFRFGPASTGNGSNYDIYDGLNGHFVGAIGDVSLSTFFAEEGLYGLEGPASNPTLTFIDQYNFNNLPPTLTDTIPNGKVYRFSTSPQVGITAPESVGFHLFPTLANEVLQYSHSADKPVVFTVLDLTGRQVMPAIHATNSNGTISIAHLPAGMYMVEARSDGNLVSAKRFVKQ